MCLLCVYEYECGMSVRFGAHKYSSSYQSPGHIGLKLEVSRFRDPTGGLFLLPQEVGTYRESQLYCPIIIDPSDVIGDTFQPNMLPFASVRAKAVNRPRTSQ